MEARKIIKGEAALVVWRFVDVLQTFKFDGRVDWCISEMPCSCQVLSWDKSMNGRCVGCNGEKTFEISWEPIGKYGI